MNASATVRASFIRQARMSIIAPSPIPLHPRPAQDEKLEAFVQVDYIEHRRRCDEERAADTVVFDVEKNAEIKQIHIENTSEPPSVMDWEEEGTVGTRIKKMVTIFPYRDPIYLVAIIFLLGSVVLTVNAFLDLIPRAARTVISEREEAIVVPATILAGSILFFIAGVFDTFGALNADRGTIGTTKLKPDKVVYRPALLGTPEFKWIPSWTKLWELTMTDLAFQAGLIVLFGGIIFMFGSILDFPGVVPEESPLYASIVFGPQVIHGLLFFIANAMLAYSMQDCWYKPKYLDADWQSSVLNTIGGFSFMLAGLFLFQRDDTIDGGELKSASAALVGSWAFLIGSIIRWYVVLEVW
ncbi:hypothetical protein ACJQWK_01614 [Exserohilum turcicum]|uniref:Integral membrane protein n=1 Tax=Exserohilum turcicum (strain 28A) TaxID=671987 RepID=R0KFY1_EXST2|nr:uncharacterized protein SETTUDRAFT_107819 [Exserohilum turcica Et28A]EOA88204.1 hypothetical protein SETTUDRAFT_107819 [Exserohilum turcica Et28A]